MASLRVAAAAARRMSLFSVAPRVATASANNKNAHKRLLKHAKGYRGKSKNCFTVAVRRVHKAWQYAYRDRRVKKREWRRLWIQRINAGARQYGIRYSRFVAHLRYCRVDLNRKVLSELAAAEPFAFKAVTDVVQAERQEYLQKKEQQAGEEAEDAPVAA